MDAKEIKNKLNNDLVIKILETIGCHGVRDQKNKIKAYNPEGDNPNAICVYTDSWNVENFTKLDFDNMKIKDIVSFVMFIENMSFSKALKRICDICEFDFYNIVPKKKKHSVIWTDKILSNNNKQIDETKLTPIPKSTLKQFVFSPINKWIKEGIKSKSQTKFKIGFCLETERITIPIYDEVGSLVGVKGRLLKDTEGMHDKYLCIYPFPKTQILYGFFQNYNDIKKADQIIIVESEKSVIKLNGYGIKNVVALSGKNISNIQAEKIIRAGVKDIVLCMDKDVTDKDIESIINKINNPIKWCDIYVMKDEFNFMKDKESPTDNIDTWTALWQDIEICK